MQDYTLKNKKGYALTEDQNEIVHALLNNSHYFNFAQTGFGKTLTTLTAAIHTHLQNKNKDIHFVILSPNSAVKAFTDTLTEQFGIPYSIYTATKTRSKSKARFHIFNYSTLGKNLFNKNKKMSNPQFEKLKELRQEHSNLYLIADEAHSLQDTATIQYKTVAAIRSWFSGMWFLTATPILNNLEGLFHMVELVKPGFFKNIYAFRHKFHILEKKTIWTTTKGGRRKPINTFEVVGYKNLELLSEKIKELGVIKAKVYDVYVHYRSTEVSEFTLNYYKQAAKGLFDGTAENKKKSKNGNKKHAGAKLHDLQRVVSNSHKEFKLIADPNKVSEKELLLIETIKEVLERNEASLIYFTYLETLERIKYILEKIKVKFRITNLHEVSGSISQAKRKLVEDNIKPRDMVLITSAGTESINLQKANNIIFYEIPFPIREFIQGCGRITRTNSTFDQFNIYVLESIGTIDTYKKNRIVDNSHAIKAVIGGGDILPTKDILDIGLADKETMKNAYLWLK